MKLEIQGCQDWLIWHYFRNGELIGILKHISSQYMEIELDDRYRGIFPAAEILNNMKCEELIVMWSGDMNLGLLNSDGAENESLREWHYIHSRLSEEDGILKSIYRQNKGGYSYTGYDFCERGSDRKLCAELISVKDRESGGGKYFDILSIPKERIVEIPVGLSINDFHKIWLYDVNFDGHDDAIYSRRGYYSYYENEVTFLWNEDEAKYEYCGTAPRDFHSTWSEEQRSFYFYPREFEPYIYSIYKFEGDAFVKESLEIEYSENRETWVYCKDEELVRKLEIFFHESDGKWYVFCEGKGGVAEDILTDKKETYEDGIGKKYFPEFDFYWNQQ